jgi:hypothetical protein
MASKLPTSLQARSAVTRANLLLQFFGGDLVRREDLLKPDLISEVILLVAGVLVFVILLLVLVVTLTQPSALV